MKSIKSQKIAELKEKVKAREKEIESCFVREGWLRERILKLETELDAYKELIDNLRDELQK